MTLMTAMAHFNPTATATFSYDSLRREDREIRLVRYSNSATSTEVELVLSRASLNSLPSYHALSYLWGDPTPTKTIRINGRPLPIADNLYQAILHLRRGGDAREWLWIDAICINQNSREEKSWQVAQMGDIFSRAALVYIWLGPSGDDSDAVLEMARRIGPDAHKAGVADLWFGWPSFKYRAETPPEDAEDVERAQSFLARTLDDGDLRSPRLLAAIQSLLGRANWYRTWVVQEIALARNGLVLCGAERVSLDAFDASLAAISFSKNSDFARGHPRWCDFGTGLNNNLFRLRGLVARRQRRRNRTAGLLEFLLSDFLKAPGRPFYMASDPRDIIFGLLGIAADTELLGLRPDYTWTAAEVYTEATRAMVERCPHYSLDYCAFPKDMHDLPSWVPDWQRIGQFGLEYDPMSYRNYFKTSGDWVQPPSPVSSPAVPDGLPSWRVLQQRGCLVDVVATVFPSDKDSSGINPVPTLSKALASRGEERSRILESILKFATAADLELDGAQIETVLWRTLVADWIGVERCTPEYDALAERTFRQQSVPAVALTEAQIAFMLRNTHPFPHRRDSIMALQAKVDEFSESMLLHASVRSRGRTLFATARGKLGLGPENMQRQDVVTILLGTPVPIVLRPLGDHFTYLGGAYVHGIMDGEFIRGDPREDDFYIA